MGGKISPYELQIQSKNEKINHDEVKKRMFTATLFVIIKKWEAIQMFINREWVSKLWFIHIMRYCTTGEINGPQLYIPL